MKPEIISTLKDFTGIIETNCTNQELFLFRGQQRDWPLLPSLMRMSNLITDDSLLETEKKMLDEFQRYSVPFLKNTPKSIIEWLTLAQHHGMPTRLLDWTQNPLSALWFAVNNPSIEENDGVLWMLKPDEELDIKDKELDNFEFDRYALLSPRHISERITAQEAWFTVHKFSKLCKQTESLEKAIGFKDKLTKLIIPWNRFAHFRYHLNSFGLNQASIYPGLDGICAHIKYNHFFMADEL